MDELGATTGADLVTLCVTGAEIVARQALDRAAALLPLVENLLPAVLDLLAAAAAAEVRLAVLRILVVARAGVWALSLDMSRSRDAPVPEVARALQALEVRLVAACSPLLQEAAPLPLLACRLLGDVVGTAAAAGSSLPPSASVRASREEDNPVMAAFLASDVLTSLVDLFHGGASCAAAPGGMDVTTLTDLVCLFLLLLLVGGWVRFIIHAYAYLYL